MAVGGYQIRIRKAGYPWGPWMDAGTEPPYQFTDLEPDTAYYVQTRAFCENGNFAGVSEEELFWTPSTPEPEPTPVGFRPFMGRWAGPSSNSPFTDEWGPLSMAGERFIWQAGDIKVTVVATTGDTANVTTPSGYAHAPGSPFTNTAGTKTINVLWKRIDVEEPLTVLDIGYPDSWAMFYNIRGAVEEGDPWIDFATVEGTGDSLTFPSVECEENCMVLFAGATSVATINTTSSFAYNWQNDNLKELVNIDGSDTNDVGHVGAFGISTVTGESGETTCTLHESFEYALWVGAIKPAQTIKPRPVGINNPSTGNITGFGRDLPFYPSIQAQESNYIFAFVEATDEVVTDSTWTEAPDSPVINESGTNPTRLHVFYKKVGTDMDVDVTFNRMGSACQTGTIVVRGAVATGDPFESISTNIGSGTSITIPGGTTTADNSLILQAVARAASTHNSASYSGWTNADLSSVTERIDAGTSIGDDAGVGIVSGVKDSAGVYGSTTATLLNNTTWATWQAAIKPAGVSAPTIVTTNSANGSGYPNSGLFSSTGIQEGDLIVTFAASDREAPDRLLYGEDYGWTFLPTTVSTTGVGLSVAYKRASGVSPFLRFTSFNDHRTISFAIVNGLDPDNPIVSTASNTGVGTSPSVPGGETTEDNTLIVHAVCSGVESGSQETTAWTNADLNGVNRGVEGFTFSGNGGYVDSAFAYKDVAGEFGDTTVTLAVSDAWAMWRAVLKKKP